MIRQAFLDVGWFGYFLIALIGVLLSAPICWWIDERERRKDREAWARYVRQTGRKGASR